MARRPPDPRVLNRDKNKDNHGKHWFVHSSEDDDDDDDR